MFPSVSTRAFLQSIIPAPVIFLSSVVKGANEEVAKDVAMQAAAMKPEYLSEENVPADRVEKEKNFLSDRSSSSDDEFFDSSFFSLSF